MYTNPALVSSLSWFYDWFVVSTEIDIKTIFPTAKKYLIMLFSDNNLEDAV
jgi:hypothetical protein